MMRSIKIKILIIALCLTTVTPALVMAAPPNTANTTTNATSGGVGTQYKYSGVDQSITQYLCTPSATADGHDLERCVNKAYRFGIAFGAIALVFFIVLAGYYYLVGGEGAKTKAKGIVQNAVVGILLLLGSYVILSFINPSLVVFKPIQPPIFSAANLPSCSDLGLGDNCVLPDEEGGNTPGPAGRTTAAPCAGGLEPIPSGIPHTASSTICKDLADKLLQVAKILPPSGENQWTVSQTWSDSTPSRSRCHHPLGWVDPNGIKATETGNCADLIMVGQEGGHGPSQPSNKHYGNLCKAVKQVGGLNYLNEASEDSDCGAYDSTTPRTGNNLHVNFVGGGSSGTGGTSSSGGSRPNCTAVSGVPGVCGDGGVAKAGLDWGSDSALKTAYTSLKAKYPQINATQAYRTPEYGAHMRSVFEAYALMNGWSESDLKSYGQYCSSLGIQYVTKADVSKYDTNAKNWVTQHFNDHFKVFSSTHTSPTTCLSDHGSGIAFDIDGAPTTAAFESAAKSVGLCHSVPNNMSSHGVTMNNDDRHWALASKLPSGGKCYSYWGG